MSIAKKINLTVDMWDYLVYSYISASFEVLSLSKTIKLNGTCTGKSK